MALIKRALIRSNGNRFTAVGEDAEITIDTSGGDNRLIFNGSHWGYLVGETPAVKTSKSQGGATSSKLFVQHLPGGGANPSRTRYLLTESSGKGFVSKLDGADEVEFAEGYFVDVTNSEPPEIGDAQEYVASQYSETATALEAAETADGELDTPEEPEP